MFINVDFLPKGIMYKVILLLLFILLPVSRADYDCLCSYLEELPVYANNDLNSDILGNMYEFDCKPIYGQNSTNGLFQQIQFEHQVVTFLLCILIC